MVIKSPENKARAYECRACDINTVFDFPADCAPSSPMIVLFAATAFIVLGVAGTVGKLLFDDWRVRQSARRLP